LFHFGMNKKGKEDYIEMFYKEKNTLIINFHSKWCNFYLKRILSTQLNIRCI